jgi:FlgD Ig-like domain
MVLVLALLAGTATAFGLTEVLKLDQAPIAHAAFHPFFSPTCRCKTATARLPLLLKKPNTIAVDILDTHGHVVRSLGTRRLPAGTIILRWNGDDASGASAPDGTYHLRVKFVSSGRTVVIPNPIVLDTQPPTVKLTDVSPRTLAGPGYGSLSATAAIGERGRLILLVDGRRAVRSRVTDPGRVVVAWNGLVHRRAILGEHVVTLEAVDRAGNVSSPTPGVIVTVVGG